MMSKVIFVLLSLVIINMVSQAENKWEAKIKNDHFSLLCNIKLDRQRSVEIICDHFGKGMLNPFKVPSYFFSENGMSSRQNFSTSAAQDPSTTFHSSTLLHPSIGFFHPQLSHSFLAFIRPHMTVIRPLGFYPSTWLLSVPLAFTSPPACHSSTSLHQSI
jgi:hypothetical protein